MSERLERVMNNPPEGETRLITYLLAGDPDSEITVRRLKELADQGVDILELGVPFSDPMADGPVIQAAAERALAKRMTVKKTLDIVAAFRKTHETPILLMSYLNPLLKYGWDKFIMDAVQAGVDGLILPDLPWKEGNALRSRSAELVGDRLTFIPMIAQTSEEEDVRTLADVEKGFVYVLSRNGITGGEAVIPQEVQDFISSLRQSLSVPYCVGFGIQKREQVLGLAGICDGVIVGSALVERFAQLDRDNLSQKELILKEQEVCRWVAGLKQSNF